MKYVRWPHASRRCLHAPPAFTRWHADFGNGRTACGYLIPVAVPLETTHTIPPWRTLCTRCRREHSDGVTGQLSLLGIAPPGGGRRGSTSTPTAPAFSAANFFPKKGEPR